MKTKRQYLYNALLLTAVTLLMRTVSVSFNVYISNKVGAEAMGLFSLISSVYGFAVTLATSGIHLATVRAVAERLEISKGAENRQCLRACLTYAASFGTLATLLLFLSARPLGLYVLKDERTVRALYLLSATLLPIALTSVLNGYFTAVRRAWKNAISQIVEQGVRISLTVALLVLVAPDSVEGCVLAILAGGAVSESLSLVLNVFLYWADKRRFRKLSTLRSEKKVQVAAIALPVAISAYARSGLLAIEHILIPRGLLSYGSGNSEALAAYGALHGMALPVVLYPAAILSSFAALLIPEMTEQQSLDNRLEIRYIAGRVYQLTLLFAIGVSGIMLSLSGELGTVLYDDIEVAKFIGLLAPLIPIMYLDTATDAMLKGLGQQVYSMNVNIVDALISVISVALLVPRMGITGYLITIYITEILNAALSITRLLKITGFNPSVLSLVLRPLLAVIGATSVYRLIICAWEIKLPHSGTALALHVTVTALLYLLLLLAMGGITQKDRRWFLHLLRTKRDNAEAK